MLIFVLKDDRNIIVKNIPQVIYKFKMKHS